MCDDFCERYIERLKGKMPSELSLEDSKDCETHTSSSSARPTTSSSATNFNNLNNPSSSSNSNPNLNNPINSSSSTSFTSQSSSTHESYTGFQPQQQHPLFKLENNDYSNNTAAATFNNTAYPNLVDCSTPIPNPYTANPYQTTSHHHNQFNPMPFNLPHHQQQLNGLNSYHNLAYPQTTTSTSNSSTHLSNHLSHQSHTGSYSMQPFFAAAAAAAVSSNQTSSYYDFSNNDNQLNGDYIKNEYSNSGGGGSMKRGNDGELKEHHTLTVLGNSSCSNSLNAHLMNQNSNSYHNLDTNSETG